MKTYQITGPHGLEALRCIEGPEPRPGPREVLVEMRAWSLNYRDLSMPRGGYLNNDKVRTDPPLVPLSDGAGEVLAVGEQVRDIQPGDRVASCFFQDWTDGDIDAAGMKTALGGAVDGVLAERVVLADRGVIRYPAHLDQAEAATLPCAALTAWEALMQAGLKAGDTILTLGTGGVSIFALQFAKASGARVIITSSSEEKLARAQALGADEVINYRLHPEWDDVARDLTDGRGVDHVIEVGGAGTLERSLRSVRVSGTVSLIGVLAGAAANPSPMLALFHRLTIRGIYVGSRARFEEMNAFMSASGIRPVIDRQFGFDEVNAAYRHLKSASHLGKIVITR